MADELNHGDRVIAATDYEGAKIEGMKGTVLYVIGGRHNLAGVAWDLPVLDKSGRQVGHSCDGKCSIPHGWTVDVNLLVKTVNTETLAKIDSNAVEAWEDYTDQLDEDGPLSGDQAKEVFFAGWNAGRGGR